MCVSVSFSVFLCVCVCHDFLSKSSSLWLSGGWYVYQQRNEVHNNCGIEIYYQTDMQTTHDNMLLELFCQIIHEPCFNTLRTKEQLGTLHIHNTKCILGQLEQIHYSESTGFFTFFLNGIKMFSMFHVIRLVSPPFDPGFCSIRLHCVQWST